MITSDDLYEYFNEEYKSGRESYLQLMKLPLKERVRKRKAIENLSIDWNRKPWYEDNCLFFVITAPVNLADFKEGDVLQLHPVGETESVNCTLTEFDSDTDIILSVSSFENQDCIYLWKNQKLVLDKSLIDLRRNVYFKFLEALPLESKWWAELLINQKQRPTLLRKEESLDFLNETEMSLGIKLNPKQREAVLKCMEADDYYLVQGPPGTGKSFILGLIILGELLHFRRRIAVIGPNHLAINNVLEQMLKTIPQHSDQIFKIGQFYNAPQRKVIYKGEEKKIRNISRMSFMASDALRGSYIVGMTPHSLYTSKARDLIFDTLIIDEAGQMSIPLALMGIVKASKVIFAGDHKQLPPIINAVNINPELQNSVFQQLANKSNCTMLNETFRMNQGICNFVSDLFYEGEVISCADSIDHEVTIGKDLLEFENPVVMLNVVDNGEQTSDKEAEAIAQIVKEYVKKGIDSNDIGILSPFRAQATNIKKELRKNIPEIMKTSPVVVETIDKMQGQEKDIIIMSFVAGNIDYMIEMSDFLYNPQKMNVAFSRAKSKLILVGNIESLDKLSENSPYIERIINSKYLRIYRNYI